MATATEIRNQLLARVPDEYDKMVGSFIYDSLAPVAIQFESLDNDLSNLRRMLDIENLTGDDLAKRIYDRTGIIRKPATFAVGSVVVTGNGAISIGDLFETASGFQFSATESKSITGSGSVEIRAVIDGPSGNVPANQITMIPVTIAGITGVNNPAPTLDGFDSETDADLLVRYFERIRTPATSGNKSHYKNWAKEVTGVGDARVIPLWSGPNTVKVVIIDSDRKVASTQLVDDVQTYIDPGITGLGEGVAPIGAYATVSSAAGLSIDVGVSISLSVGFTLEQATDNVEVSLTEYLKDIAFSESIVSYAKVGAAILDSDGVEDYSGLTVNGGTSNVAVGFEQVAVLGSVDVDV
ncbi:baseplate J/gp47 family protein [Cohnella cholangitidis]|uniref:Baseplate J/gp47 family protein n=1 Tax=Cohnella cholangitidis TaxID=2598458 RepID=A0A7G5C3G5_9BACL|nr:baseplate J/gp47 family protein [Cohnella cholangitidis]QMV43749.1 baseplate J/gp47 family protein [Cohnella cholangitidis]